VIGWAVATRTRFCGRCGAQIAKGEPMQEVSIEDVKSRKIRCRLCAGEQPPADLPARPARPLGMTSTRSLAQALPEEWKVKQAQG